MDRERAPEHQWPDDEPVRDEQPAPPRSRRQRIMRALGDIFLTAGMGRAFGGPAVPPADKAAMNVILFGEGDSKGHEADRGSGSGDR